MLQYFSQKLFLLCALLALGLNAQAQGGQTMSLNDCVQFALENHPDVKAAKLQVSDAKWRVKENLATGLPQISAGLSYNGFLQRGGLPSGALSFGGGGGSIDPNAAYFQTLDQALGAGGVDASGGRGPNPQPGGA